jgi:hypothetical protein
MAQNKIKIIEEMEIDTVSELTNEESLKESETSGVYRFCGFAISDYAAETGVTSKELMDARIVTGIISSDDKFSYEELIKLGDELEELHPDIVVFDYWYHHQEKNDELSDENIEKVADVLGKRLGLYNLNSYENRLAYGRTKDRLMLIEVNWNYGGEACVVSARNARHAFNVFKTAPNHISDMLPCDGTETMANLKWKVTEEKDEMHLSATSSEFIRHKINISISPLEIPEGRVGYSLMSYVE